MIRPENLFIIVLAQRFPTSPDHMTPLCEIYKDVGANDLCLHDVVVKNPETNTACIRATFSLAIQVTDQEGALLGYLPLESVVDIDDSCPEAEPKNSETPTGTTTESNDSSNDNDSSPMSRQEQPDKRNDEMRMTLFFQCAELTFEFKKADNYYLSSIRGTVNLDSYTIKEFVVERPMFHTSDLNHHFKHPGKIEVQSTEKTKAFVLTANFYDLEFEVFRNTASRDYIRPPDLNSKVFMDQN